MSNSAPQGVRAFLFDNAFVGLAQVLTKLRGLILIPLLVKGLGTESYGIYAQAISFVALAGGVFALNLHLPFIQFVAQDPEQAPASVTTLKASMLASTVLASIFLFVAATPHARGFFVGTENAHVFLGALALTITSTSRMFVLNAYRATNRIKLRSILDFGSSLVDLLGSVAMVTAGYGLSGVFYFSAAWGVVFNAASFVHVARLLGVGPFQIGILKRALRYSLPLVPAAIAGWLLDRGDRFLLNAFLGPREVGIYSAQYALASLASVMMLPLQITLVPKVAQLWPRDRELARRYLDGSMKVLVATSVPFVAICTACAPQLLTALANEEVAFHSRITVTAVGVGATLWAATILQSLVFYSTGSTAKVGFVTAVAAGLNLGTNFLLIPRAGLVGAALATTLSYAGAFALMTMLARGETLIRYDRAFLLRICLGAAVSAVPAFVAAERGYPVVGALLSGLVYLLALVTFVVERDTLRSLKHQAASFLRRGR